MRHLNIQLQPERASSLDLFHARRVIESLAKDRAVVGGFEASAGDDEGPYINFTFAAKDPTSLWATIQRTILRHPELGAAVSAASIIIVEGDDGWNDYLLLHHFDPKYEVDEADDLPSTSSE